MNEEEKKAFKVINTRTRRLLDELEIEKEDMSDEPKIAYLMQEIRANKTILNLVEKLQKENEDLHRKINQRIKLKIENEKIVDTQFIPIQKVKDKIEEIQKEYNKLDKQIDEYINDVNKDLAKYYESKEKISIMQTLSCFIDILQELLEGRK